MIDTYWQLIFNDQQFKSFNIVIKKNNEAGIPVLATAFRRRRVLCLGLQTSGSWRNTANIRI